MLYLLLGLLLLVIGLVVVVLIIVGVIASPAFRIAAIVVAGLLIWALNSAREEAKQNALQRVAADKFAVSAIKPSDLKIEDVKLSGDEPSYVLDGVVTNMSTFMLAGIYFEISMTDCKNTECRVVGQRKQARLSMSPRDKLGPSTPIECYSPTYRN
jgi:hypothetical protein